MIIIFLEFDGVMSCTHYGSILKKEGLPSSDEFGAVFNPDCVKNLKEIVDKTGARIVITTSWKSIVTYQQLVKMWEQRGLPGCVIDTMPNRNKRGDELDAWLKECDEECQYVILDDLLWSDFNEHQIPRLISVHPFDGLNSEEAERAISILNNEHNPCLALNESLKKVTNNKDCIGAVFLTLHTVNQIKLMIDWIGRHQKDNPTDRTLICIAERIKAIVRDHWLEKIETYYYPNGAVKEVIEYFTQWRALKTNYDEDGKVINTSEILKNYGSMKENQQYKDCELTFII